MRLLFVTLVAAMCSTARVDAERLEFEAATVKVVKDDIARADQDRGGANVVRTPNRLVARNMELPTLIEMAFQTRLYDVSRVPESLRSARFDISATGPGEILGDQYWEMLKNLLEDRFKLKYHRETRDAQVYALTLAKNRTAPGPKMTPSTDANCPANPTAQSFCGVAARPGFMNGQRVNVARLVRELSAFAGRSVQDATGLTGIYDFTLTWTPDQDISADGRAKLLNGGALDSSGANFFSAVQEQLGLKLEPKKGQIELLVVDHAEFPAGN